MSLSRYYKSSDLFQPAELVKQDDSGRSGWKIQPRSDEGIFSSRPLLGKKELPAIPANEAVPQPPPVDDIPAEGQASSDTPGPDSSPDNRPSGKETIDLGNYIELAAAEQQREEAYRSGFDKGCEEERKRAEEDFGAAGRALLLACRQLDALRETIIANSSKEILEFTLAIAEKIVRISVQEQDATIVATIEEALRKAVKSDEFSIFLHPDDHASVSAKAGEIIAGISGLNNVVLRKDKTVERGGAKLESDNCTIDATIAGQFELIREEVRKRL